MHTNPPRKILGALVPVALVLAAASVGVTTAKLDPAASQPPLPVEVGRIQFTPEGIHSDNFTRFMIAHGHDAYDFMVPWAADDLSSDDDDGQQYEIDLGVEVRAIFPGLSPHHQGQSDEVIWRTLDGPPGAGTVGVTYDPDFVYEAVEIIVEAQLFEFGANGDPERVAQEVIRTVVHLADDLNLVLNHRPEVLDALPDPYDVLDEDPSYELPVDYAVHCQLDRFHGLVPQPQGESDGCRSLNSLLFECEENGDCQCGSQEPLVPLEDDTDHDGVPNSEDPDDDCDHLSDSLEEQMPMDPLTEDDPFNMRPLDDGKIEIHVAVGAYETNAQGDGTGGGGDDPYAKSVYISTLASAGQEHELVLPGFNVADHPEDSNTFSFGGSDDTWASTMDAVQGLSSDFRDVATWALRDPNCSGVAVSCLPMVNLRMEIWEDDNGLDDTSTLDDDSYGAPQDLALNLIQGATDSVKDFLPKPWGMGFSHANMNIGIDLQFAVRVCAPAVSWAEIISNGAYLVNADDLAAQIVPGACSP